MRLKNLSILLVFTGISVFSCRKDSIGGEGSIVTENRTVEAFQKVEFSGEGSVTVLNGPAQTVKIEGYENLVPIFESRVSGNTLVLKYKSNYNNIRNSNIRVTITTPDIKSIFLNGSGNIRTGQHFNGSELSMEINGSGTIFSEASEFAKLHLKINGSGKADVDEIISDHADVTINGSGDIRVLALESLKARISGSGTIRYSGNPETVDTQISGSGKVIRN